VIADLEARRDEVLQSLERLSTELAGTATQHAKVIADRAADTAAKVRDDDDGSDPEGDEENTQTMPASKSGSRAS
jgi:hypothetical protein